MKRENVLEFQRFSVLLPLQKKNCKMKPFLRFFKVNKNTQEHDLLMDFHTAFHFFPINCCFLFFGFFLLSFFNTI